MYKPTKSMVNFAKRGIEMHNNGESSSDMPKRTLEIGKRIASGQNLSDEHITDMAHFHSSHDCPKDCEDLLWGGPAGEMWAKSNLMKSLNTGFSDDLNKLIEDKTDLSFEIFSDINLEEPISLGEDDSGLIWAPILRSGMLATRPGPNGEKLDEPLIFVSGHSENQLKQIGLEDIVDAFNDKAVEYVTIPTSHNNDLLENTGFIRQLKIVDSKKIPGEKLIVAGHDFTEPDIKGRVQRGTIPSRSSGLLYDYKNTTTGKVYPVVLEHTALTHKPWVGGMAPYGQISETDFSERIVVPMMLSEKSVPAEEIEKISPTKLAQETNINPTKSQTKQDFNGEFLADVQWGKDLSNKDIERQISSILEKMCGDNEDSYPYYYVLDNMRDSTTSGKALIKVNYGIGNDNDAWVCPYIVNDKQIVELSPFSDWTDVTQKWVSDTIDPDEDKAQLDKLKMSEDNINLATLTSKERKKLPKTSFVYPDEEKYPIHDKIHADIALVDVSKNGTPKEQSEVRAAVYKKYPQMKKNKESSTKMSDPLKTASANRLGTSETNHEPPGGHMKLLMSEEQMDRLGLSAEAREVITKQNAEYSKLQTKLAETEKEEKKTRVEKRIADLSEEGLKEYPGLLKEIESTYLSDDGDIALKLKLSEHGHEVSVPETATQIVDRLVKAFPRNKDNKIKLSEQGSLLASPISGRPPLSTPEENEDKVKTGADLAQEMVKADPSLAEDPSIKKLLALSSDNGKGQ